MTFRRTSVCRCAALGLAFGFAVLSAAPASAQATTAAPVDQFYRGKLISLYIGFTVGGGYDVYGRLVARYLGKHIPGNPTVVPVNMEGAGSVKLANWLYNVAPKDGSAIGIVNRGVPFEPLVGNAALARFDGSKFTWLGSTTDEVSVCVAWKRTGITRFEELYEKELIVGGTGAGADDYVFPKVIGGILGARMRLVSGYPGGNDVDFAMERGEVDGRCGWSWSSVVSTRQEWLRNGNIKVLLQVALRKHPDMPDVPLVMDLARNDEERQIMRLVFLRLTLGRPFLAPPGIPPQRAAILQNAFDAMVKDPIFLAEAKRLRLEISPISGRELQKLMVEAATTPPALLAKARRYVQ